MAVGGSFDTFPKLLLRNAAQFSSRPAFGSPKSLVCRVPVGRRLSVQAADFDIIFLCFSGFDKDSNRYLTF